MYTAKITSKVVESNGALALTVEFSNGSKTITEVVKPQDEEGYEHWIKSRLTSLETSDKLKLEDNIGDIVTLESLKEVVTDSSARTIWFNKLNKLYRIKTYAIDLGVLTGEEKEIVDLVNDLKLTYLPEYAVTF